MDSWHDEVEPDDDQDAGLADDRYGGKDAIIFLIDVASPDMHETYGNEEDTPFQKTLKCVHTTLRRKILGSPNDVLGVLLYGTPNKWNVRDFDNLSLVLPLDTPEGKSINAIEEMVTNMQELKDQVGDFQTGNSAWMKFAIHEAFWQCQSLFNDVKGKVALRKVILFTTNDDPHANDQGLKRQALKKANDLAETGIILEVIPLSSPRRCQEGGTTFDWSKFYTDLVTREEETGGDMMQEEQSSQKLEDLLRMVKKRIYKKRSTGRCHLDLGNGVQIAVSTYNFVQKAQKSSKVWLTRATNEEVKLQRQFMDGGGRPLLPSDISKFMEYGKNRIKLTQDEVRMTQKMMDNNLGLKLIAFKPLKGSKGEIYFVRSSHFIYPDEASIKGSRNLFAALMTKCLERDVYALCSFKPRETSLQTFVALYPQNEVKCPDDGSQKTPPGFLLAYLPFLDDMRDIPEPSPILHSSQDQVDAARKVIKKLKLKHYDPEAFENPALQAHYRFIESAALEKTDEEEEDMTDRSLPPFGDQRKRLGHASQAFLDAIEPDSAAYDIVESRKRAAMPPPSVAKKAKIGDAFAHPLDTDSMKKLVQARQVEKLTVDKLKAFLKSVGGRNVHKKKPELVEDVYDHFLMD